MDIEFPTQFATHIALAIALFFLVNWIGKHAEDFGYVSNSLFEESNESLALNFFIRALSPAVFIIILASAVVALDLSRFSSVSLNWINPIKENYYGTRPHRRIQA